MTPTESVLTQRIASLTWRLMRADRLQTTVINTLVDAQHKASPPPKPRIFNIPAMIETLREKYEDPEVTISDAAVIIAGLVRFKNTVVTSDPAVDKAICDAMDSREDSHICAAEIELGTVIYNDFHGSAVIERLQSYEQRIESSLFKTIRQYHLIQETRIKNDAARDRRAMQRLRAEDQAKRDREEAEYRQNIREKSNPDVDPHCHSDAHCHSERSRGIRQNTIAEGDSNQIAPNEPNSDLTSITEMTYNRSRDAKAKLDEGQSRRAGDPERPSQSKHQ